MQTLFTAALLGAVFSLPLAAVAEEGCARRADIIDHLARQYAETPIAVATVDGRRIVEVLAPPDRSTWTMIVTRTDGISCILATGEDWQSVPQPTGKGEGA